MRLTAVVAASDNNVIGRGNALPWHLPADLAYFKRVTMGKPILMGRRTYEAIGRPLPGRRNLVLSRGGFVAPGVETVTSIDMACALLPQDTQLMILGGATLYRESLPRVSYIHLTRVHCQIEGDAFFPDLPAQDWQVVTAQEQAPDDRNQYAMTFTELRRVTAVVAR